LRILAIRNLVDHGGPCTCTPSVVLLLATSHLHAAVADI
jgi:hypothetical protein